MEVVGYWFQDRYSLNLCFMTNGSRGKSRFLKSARFAWGGGGRLNLLNIPTAHSGQDKQCKMSISIDRDWETLHMPETLHIHLHILG